MSAFGGVVAAHFPAELDVDVQPGNEDNFVDLDEHESVTVAVFRSEFLDGDGEAAVFDPTDEPVRYRFGSRSELDDGDGARPTDGGTVETFDAHSEEGESRAALVLDFPVAETGFDGGEETAWLYWERDDSGEHGYAGYDTLTVYENEVSNHEIVDLLRASMNSTS
ncbi:hypothetical protein G9464_17895 [Halostella sp. JP-L12]|nr:hypothetical protein [Halostella sp. JP-L12]